MSSPTLPWVQSPIGRRKTPLLSWQGLSQWGFWGGTSGKQPACQRRRRKRHGFDPWVSKIPWKRAWQPTSVFLPGESHGQGTLAGCSPLTHKESDTTDVTYTHCLLLPSQSLFPFDNRILLSLLCGDMQVACHCCRSSTAILWWSQINPSLVQKYQTVYLFGANKYKCRKAEMLLILNLPSSYIYLKNRNSSKLLLTCPIF